MCACSLKGASIFYYNHNKHIKITIFQIQVEREAKVPGSDSAQNVNGLAL